MNLDVEEINEVADEWRASGSGSPFALCVFSEKAESGLDVVPILFSRTEFLILERPEGFLNALLDKGDAEFLGQTKEAWLEVKDNVKGLIDHIVAAIATTSHAEDTRSVTMDIPNLPQFVLMAPVMVGLADQAEIEAIVKAANARVISDPSMN